MKLKVQKPRGMKDIFGEEAKFYLFIRNLLADFSLLHNFNYIETPLVENVKTFTASLGTTSDVIEKEMFYLKNKDSGDYFVLRPENTASIVRAYFENGMNSLPQPVSLFYLGTMYRRERPQHGRLREHRQWGLEILNSEDPFADFYIIFTIMSFFKKVKINGIKIKLNSLGCAKCSKKFRKNLLSYYRPLKNKICSDCQRRFKLNPLRLLDCKNEKDLVYKQNAPNILDFLCKFCKLHFQKVLELFEYFHIDYELDKTLVRGFDYYSRTVFEIFVEQFDFAIASGGRYDLGPVIGNISLPSVGGAVGLERLKIVLDNIDFKYKFEKPKIFVAFTGEEIRPKAFEIYLDLQAHGFNPLANFFKSSLASQLEFANKNGLKYSLILGFQELSRESIILKEMEHGTQEVLKLKNLPLELKKIIKYK
ncbi:MAG: histidine--tRNA ligase [Candidatus Parcubacteria bacterium]|nr:MAG: histidine--tRNA ligase [Candidatus Parcubacteria bacterium]